MTGVEDELIRDDELLRAVETGAPPMFRTWRAARRTVVVGRAVVVAEEVDEAFCASAAITIVRRSSGGRSVVVGPGTLQYAFALPYEAADELATIGGSKRFCNSLLLDGLAHASGTAAHGVVADVSGDLVRDGRKVAGVALRRRRAAMLLHGTILSDADLGLIARVLKHPRREPEYRSGRPHEQFLANLGPIDDALLAQTIVRRLSRR